jgi:hypothetical protein
MGMVVNAINHCLQSSSFALALHIFVLELDHPSFDSKDMLQAIQAIITLSCSELVLNCGEVSHTNNTLSCGWYSQWKPRL